MSQPTYLDIQPLRRNPAVWLVVPFSLLFWGLAFVQLGLGITVGTRPASNLGMALLWLGIGVALPGFLLLPSLKTEVDARGVTLTFRPLTSRTILRAQIVRAYTRTCGPIGEYGGWGFRIAFGNRRAYLTAGTSGVQLELVGGQQVFTGSRRSEELLEALNP